MQISITVLLLLLLLLLLIVPLPLIVPLLMFAVLFLGFVTPVTTVEPF